MLQVVGKTKNLSSISDQKTKKPGKQVNQE